MVERNLLELANKNNAEERQLYVTTPATDPYLVWAVLSHFRGYETRPDSPVDEDGQQVLTGGVALTVESLYGWQPWRSDETEAQECQARLKPQAPLPERSREDPYLIFPMRRAGPTHTAVFTGQVDGKVLDHLLRREHANDCLNHVPSLRIEFNQARTDDGSVQGADRPPTEDFFEPTRFGATVIAIIDHGCAFAHPQFRKQLTNKTPGNEKWETRVKRLWDQDQKKTVTVAAGNKELARDIGHHWLGVEEFLYGREMTDEAMNYLIAQHYDVVTRQLDETAIYRTAEYATLESRSTHGTGVMDMAAGAIHPITGQRDAASDADIIFVQLPRDSVGDTSGGSMTRYVLDAFKYIFKHTAGVKQLVINLSFGSTAGPHDGSSLLERAMDILIEEERAAHPDKKLEVFLPAGNHYLAQCHASVIAGRGLKTPVLHWALMPDDRTDNFLELWCPKDKHVSVQLVSPSGRESGWSQNVNTAQKLWPAKMEIKPADESSSTIWLRPDEDIPPVGAIIRKQDVAIGLGQVVLLALGPTHRDTWAKVEHGVWKVQIRSDEPGSFQINGWVERDDALVSGWRQPQSFLIDHRSQPRQQEDIDTPEDVLRRRGTGNSLANGRNPIVVGAEVMSTGRPSDYTGAGVDVLTGSLIQGRDSWPDWSAPADESESLSGLPVAGTRSGSLVRMNGSSVAAPQMARAYINAWSAGRSEPLPDCGLRQGNQATRPESRGRLARRSLRYAGNLPASCT